MKNPRATPMNRSTSVHLKAALLAFVLLLPVYSRAEIMVQLITQALVAHPSIQALQAQISAARVGVESAAWQFYPTPGFRVEEGRTQSSGNLTSTVLSLQQPIWTGGRLTAGKEKAESSVLFNQASLEGMRQQLALQVVQTYSDWLLGHLKTIANKRSLDAHAELKKKLKRRIETGVSAESDMAQVQSRMSTIYSDIALAKSQKDAALARLAQLLGSYPDTTQLATDIAQPLEIGLDARLLSDMAQERSPLVQKARAEAGVQQAVIDERKANLVPEVFLRAERQYGDRSSGGTYSDTRFFVGMSSRFGAGLSSSSGVNEARHLHQAAQAEIEVQKLAVSAQVQADHVLAMSFVSRQESLHASFQAALQVSESYARQFMAGRKSWVDVMNAQRDLTQIELQLAELTASRVVLSWRMAIYSAGLASAVGEIK